MASRREQKEQLRREREQREAAARANAKRRQTIGYLAGGGLVLVAVIVAVVLLAGGGGGDGSGGSAAADVLPDGGSYPEPQGGVSLAAAAEAAGCELESFKAKSREHLADLSATVNYASKPPTSGKHFQTPAEDAAYEESPDVKELVHTLEHGRVIVWFQKDLPKDDRAALKKFYDDDPYQMVLTPDPTGMSYQVAATAWSRDPQPNGTGRLLGCPRFDDDVFTALQAFKDEHRGGGPEPVP